MVLFVGCAMSTDHISSRAIPRAGNLKEIMKAKLIFELPEEQIEFSSATNGSKWRDVVWDLDQKLRSMHKYEDKNNVSIEDVRKMIRELMEDDHLSFDR